MLYKSVATCPFERHHLTDHFSCIPHALDEIVVNYEKYLFRVGGEVACLLSYLAGNVYFNWSFLPMHRVHFP